MRCAYGAKDGRRRQRVVVVQRRYTTAQGRGRVVLSACFVGMNKLNVDDFLDPRRRARDLYWQGWQPVRIAGLLQVKPQTLYSWKRRDKWDEATPLTRVQAVTEARLVQLINMPVKGNSEYKEMDALQRLMERQARVSHYQQSGRESDLNPNVAQRGKGPKEKPKKNVFDEVAKKRLHEAFMDSLFDYQRGWYDAKQYRIRNLLKSRQIGATFYFAREALTDAVAHGQNQLFLSASKAQAHVFKQYIVDFAREAADVELRGDPLILWNGAQLHFLGTSSRNAQSYHGNLYFDEYFWVNRFQELRKVASGMALHKQYRQTYFSTPSTLNHEAYPFWTGALFNRGRAKDDKAQIDVSHSSLASGRLCQDGQWRQIVTINDAIAGGCDLFDLDQLLLEYNPEEIANLLMCEFIDDSASVFTFVMMTRCMLDSWEVWEDFKPFALRPLGSREVWVGYDPASTGDSAACVVVAPPLVPGGKFRILEKYQWHGMDFDAQAQAIKGIYSRYQVGYIGIDTTGIGEAVYQLVQVFYPAARAFKYSVEIKSQLVLKTLDVISKGRLEFDAGWTDMAASFMAIRKTTTTGGRQVTFVADRNEEVSHADLAWATMHALFNEPFAGYTGTNSGFMELM